MTAPFGSTATAARTLKAVIDEANPNEIADVLRLLKLGTSSLILKRTFTGLTSATSFDLTAIDATGETTGIANPNRLPAEIVRTLRVTAGTLAAGPAIVTDSGGTATAIGTGSAHVVLISDDGKTLTFQAAVTAFVIEYIPLVLSATQLAANYPT